MLQHYLKIRGMPLLHNTCTIYSDAVIMLQFCNIRHINISMQGNIKHKMRDKYANKSTGIVSIYK